MASCLSVRPVLLPGSAAGPGRGPGSAGVCWIEKMAVSPPLPEYLPKQGLRDNAPRGVSLNKLVSVPYLVLETLR